VLNKKETKKKKNDHIMCFFFLFLIFLDCNSPNDSPIQFALLFKASPCDFSQMVHREEERINEEEERKTKDVLSFYTPKCV